MNFAKSDDHLSLDNSVLGDGNCSDMPGSFDQDLKTRHSSKKSDSLFTRRENQYHGIKDSLLLYEGQSFEMGRENATSLPRRQMSGARDNNRFERPSNNFNRNKHVWYRTDKINKSVEGENSTDRSFSPNSSINIRDALGNAAHSIAKSQRACLGMKERLEKYNLNSSIRMPGSFSNFQASNATFDEVDRGEKLVNLPEDEDDKTPAEPISYISACLMGPIVIKTIYFLLAQSATLESKDYSFSNTCVMIVSSELSGFSLPQLDNLILQITQIWLLIRIIPVLIKVPWRFHATVVHYGTYPHLSEHLYDVNDKTLFHDAVSFFNGHEKFGLRLKNVSLIVLVISPFVLTTGLLLGHNLTVKLATYDLPRGSSLSVYSSFMAMVFSRSQFAMLMWCIMCQYCKDAFEHVENYVIDQQKKFQKDAESIANRFESSESRSTDGLDAGTKHSILIKKPLLPSKKKAINNSFDYTHPVDSPSSQARLPSFAVAAYESPLKSKRANDTLQSSIRPVSPQVGIQTVVAVGSDSQSWRDYAKMVVKIPLHVLSMKYKIMRLCLKAVVYVIFLSYWVVKSFWRWYMHRPVVRALN
ncbi:LAFA_0G06876g1_1 [Lachancea sp. 'fantastica']|nr:LAFA_0G06876g1_1 [Lachancea sp. 'fantastica']